MTKSTYTVINNGREPLMLDDGTQIGAAYTPEAKREGVTLSERDRSLYVETGRLTVVESESPEQRMPAATKGKEEK